MKGNYLSPTIFNAADMTLSKVTNGNNSLSLEDLRAQRKEVVKREPLYQNKVRIRNPKRFAELNYKIVLV